MRLSDPNQNDSNDFDHYYYTTYKCDCQRLAAEYIPTTPTSWVCNTYVTSKFEEHPPRR